MHIIGTYDYVKRRVSDSVSSMTLAPNEEYSGKILKLKNQCRDIIEHLKRITAEVDLKISEEEGAAKENSICFDYLMKQINTSPLYELYGEPVEWESKVIDRSRVLRLLGVEIPERCFNFFKLHKIPSIGFEEKWSIEGDDNEKVQYKLLEKLSRELACLEARASFPETFKFYTFIPIAIQNTSINADSDVRITIWPHDRNLVKPQKTLLSPKCRKLECLICADLENDEEGLIHELF